MELNRKIIELREKLEEEIDKSESLTKEKILKLNSALDKLIIEYYKEKS